MYRLEKPSSEENPSSYTPECVSEAARRFRADGAIILDNVLPESSIERARNAFLEQYARYLTSEERTDALTLGHLRSMITLDIQPPFDCVEFMANDSILSVVRRLLGADCVLGFYGVACSLSGAEQQQIHRDQTPLFEGTGIDRILPPAGITVGIPLVELNEFNGTTQIWPSSHLKEAFSESDPSVLPRVPVGSCIMWDDRTMHGGTPNLSQDPRPLMSIGYQKPWYVDMNLTVQPGIRASKNFVENIPEHLKPLFARLESPYLLKNEVY